MSAEHEDQARKNEMPRADFLGKAAAGAAGLLLAESAAAARVSAAPARRRSKAPVTLTFWKGPHKTGNIEATSIAAPVLKKFEAENPDIKVDFLLTPWTNWTEKYTTAF